MPLGVSIYNKYTKIIKKLKECNEQIMRHQVHWYLSAPSPPSYDSVTSHSLMKLIHSWISIEHLPVYIEAFSIEQVKFLREYGFVSTTFCNKYFIHFILFKKKKDLN